MGTSASPRVIAAGLVMAAERDLAPGVVELEGGRITRVRAGGSRRADAAFPRATLVPGFIDLQINGAAGVDFLTADPLADLAPVRRYLLSTGVTGFLPTLVSTPADRITSALRRWAQASADRAVPRLLGIHLEGPYLNPAFAGAHDPDALRLPDPAQFTSWLASAGGLVRLVTLAPELPRAEPLIRLAVARGIAVAAGHTAATYEEARRGFERGVRVVTHLFNAMRPMHHREPGIAGAALADRRVVAGLIADLVHVHPAVVRMAITLKGADRVALVSDAITAAGGGPGAGQLAGRALQVRDAARLPDGTLAGSILALDQAIRNVVSLGVPLRDAVRMASAVPAAVLRRHDLGRIAPGARADLVVLDRRLRVRAVYAGGNLVFP